MRETKVKVENYVSQNKRYGIKQKFSEMENKLCLNMLKTCLRVF